VARGHFSLTFPIIGQKMLTVESYFTGEEDMLDFYKRVYLKSIEEHVAKNPSLAGFFKPYFTPTGTCFYQRITNAKN
jgi:hypothetical protein